MLDKYPKEVKLVFKHFPLSKHKFARTAAAAALAADRQARFWEFHEKLFQNYKSLDDRKIQSIARLLGLDMARFNKEMKDPAIERLIVRDMRDGQRIGVRGTPAVFINGKFARNRTLQGMQQMIQKELDKRG